MSIINSDQSFDAVYYNFPVPTNPYTISLLGILFDRILLPGVYLPKGQDKKAIQERIQFLIRSFEPDDVMGQREMVGTLSFINDYDDLLDIFIPTGKPGYMGILEPETKPVVDQLEQLVYGPPPPGFIPTPNMGFNQPAGNDQINAPSWISYPANSLVYARKNGLPILSDSTLLPIPEIPITLSEVDAKALAAYLMTASFSAILPRMRALNSQEILEIRSKMTDDISIFRAAMMSGVNKYVDLVGNNPTQAQLESQAKYIAETDILPKVEQLKLKFEDPKFIFARKFIDLTMEIPELVLNFQKSEDVPWAVVKALSSVTSKIKEAMTQCQTQKKEELSSGLSLLLKVPRKFPKR